MNYRKIIQIVLICFVIASTATNKVTRNKISCETKSILVVPTGYSAARQNVCWMHNSITTDSNNAIISADSTVTTLILGGNKNHKLLPVDVAISFPRLRTYSAWNNSIEIIQKRHFENLTFLTNLNLCRNQIKTVASDTFEGLTSIVYIRLGEQNF